MAMTGMRASYKLAPVMQTPGRPSSNPFPVRRLIWFAFLIAVVIYGVVGYVLGARSGMEVRVPGTVWLALAVACGAAAILAPRFMPTPSGPPASGASTRDLVVWALDESIAVIGLVSVLLGASTETLVVYVAASLVLLLLHRPR
jgi:hypothetical protein